MVRIVVCGVLERPERSERLLANGGRGSWGLEIVVRDFASFVSFASCLATLRPLCVLATFFAFSFASFVAGPSRVLVATSFQRADVPVIRGSGVAEWLRTELSKNRDEARGTLPLISNTHEIEWLNQNSGLNSGHGVAVAAIRLPQAKRPVPAIGHQAVGFQPRLEAFDPFGEDPLEGLVVAVRFKDRQPGVGPLQDV